MSIYSSANMVGDDATLAGQESQGQITSSPRDLFTEQTGQVLLEIGNMFIHIPPFNEHVDRSTGEMLISLGNKLRSRK